MAKRKGEEGRAKGEKGRPKKTPGKKARRNPGKLHPSPVTLRASKDRKLLEEARAVSREFHGTAGEVVELTAAERKPLPRYVVVAGALEDFTYSPDATSKRGKLSYRHESGDRGPLKARSNKKPLLAVDPRTRRPVIVPHRSPMRFTKDGFEG